MDTTAQTTLKEIVYGVLNILNEDNTEYMRYFRILLDVIVDFKIFHIKGVNVVEIQMDDNHRIQLPDDCIRVTAIGIPVDGKMWTFTRENKLYLGQSIKSGVLTTDSDTTDGNIEDRDSKYGYSATGGKNQYYYTIDYTNRTIVISGSPKTMVTIYYISSGISSDTTTYLPIETKNAFQAALIYKSKIYDKTLSLGERQLIEKEYRKEVTKLRLSNTMRNIDDIHDSWLKSLRQTIQR